MLLAVLGSALASTGTPGTEFVIVLDNSCSMVEPHSTKNDLSKPAADPDRRAVLGAQIVEGLTAGTDDHLSVLGFPIRKRTGVLELEGAEAVRDIAPASGTWFDGPLRRARSILDASERRDKMLLVLSDGVPSDYSDPAEGRRKLGLDEPGSDFDTLVLGLFRDVQPEAERFMEALARHPSDYQRVDDGAEVVSHFTRGYASALGSRALTGSLEANASTSFEVGRYVTEVLAVTTTTERTGPYEATLRQGQRPLKSRRKGDNGCSHRPRKNPSYCDGPRMHFEVWRADHDPAQPSQWTLGIGEAGGTVAYGVILRYDLVAAVDSMPPAKIDTPSPIRARLTWNGETFDDASFFASDDFTAVANANGERVNLAHVGDGVFEGLYTPHSSRTIPLSVTFTNTWMSKTATGQMTVVKPPALTLKGPDALDFGAWRGGRWSTSSCKTLTMTSNHSFPSDNLSFRFDGLPDGASLQLDPVEGGWNACVRAKGCCSDLISDGTAALVMTATDAEGSAATVRVPLKFAVDRTGFLRCWWPWILAALLLLFLLWFLLGWIRPHDFDEDLTVKVAGSERQLSRSAALVLREQPKGRRGFYRNARVSLTSGGDFVAKPRSAAVWFEATGSGDTVIHLQGPLEVKDRRTKQWTWLEPEAANDGIRTNIVYRLGDIYIRFQ